jgi:ferredoxin
LLCKTEGGSQADFKSVDRESYYGKENIMIITKQKPFEEITRALRHDRKIFLVGCTECATVCKTGGEPELAEMKKKLEAIGKVVTGCKVVQVGCNLPEVKKTYQQNKEGINNADALLIMSCGNGARCAMEGMRKVARIANDTLFLGQVSRAGYFQENCSLCAQCVLNETEGICPMTFCPKGLLNGPCGGYTNGKCEVDRERDCGWVQIYEKLKEKNRQDEMKEPVPPRDYSKSDKPKVRQIEGVAIRLGPKPEAR